MQHRIGDVANGHVLTQQGWVPLPPAPPPPAPPPAAAPSPAGAGSHWGTPASTWPGPAVSPRVEADRTASSIATYERVSGVVWIAIGVVQVLLIYTALAGIWNIVAGISRLRIAPAIERRDPSVPQAFTGVAQLVVIGLVNLFFGAAFGVIMVAVDFVIRQRVLDNRHIFTGPHGGPWGGGTPGFTTAAPAGPSIPGWPQAGTRGTSHSW